MVRDKSSARVILHLTHTDPRSDSRILKAMEAGSAIQGVEVVAIGKEDPGISPQIGELDNLTFFMIPRRSKAQFNEAQSTPRNAAENQLEPFGRERTIALRAFFSGFRERLLWAFGYLGTFTFSPRVRSIVDTHFSPGDFAIIHVHDFLMLFSGVRLKKTYGGKLIYDAHELEAQTNGISAFNSLLTKLVEKLLWKHIDGLITVSPGIEKHYLTTYGALPSAVVLNSPKFPASLPQDLLKSDVRKALGLESTAILFVYVGYLQSGRGIQATLDAFSGLPNNFHVAFLGKGPLAATIDYYAAKTGRIHRLDPVHHDRVVPFISAANYGLCLVEAVSKSDELALPNKLFECIAAGLPILGSNLPEIERVLTESNCGVTTGLETTLLGANIQSLAKNPFTPSPTSFRQFSWEEQAKNLVTLYGQLGLNIPT